MLLGQKVVPTPIEFGIDGMKDLNNYVYDQIQNLKQAYQELHSTLLPEWRRIYEGRPLRKEKNFPWKNASNIVIQLVGQHVDTLQARVIASIYELLPVWPISLIGKWDEEEQAEEQRQALEDFLSHCSLNPDELDLYRVESLWASDTIKFGSAVIKCPYEEDIEVMKVGGKEFSTETPIMRFSGPKPEKLPYESFSVTPTAPTLNKAKFKYHHFVLCKPDLEERSYLGRYDKAAVDKILESPDRNGPSPEIIDEYQKKGLNVSSLYNSGEWDIYECWFPYYTNDKKYRLIVTYHEKTRTILKGIFNFYPDNEEPFIMGRIGYKDDGILGRGFVAMLKDYQEEVTTGHNQRCDNRTLKNTAILRVPKNSYFDSQFQFVPGMTIPGEKDEIEVIAVGSPFNEDFSGEMLTIKEAEDRSGVGPSTSGFGGLGSGTVGKTSGAYSAAGTYSLMQEGNRTVGANITDFKYAHIKLGQLIAKINAHFGTDGREDYFGERREIILKALDSFKNKRLGFNIRAATASINREIEKQNYLLLTGIMQRHYTAVGQMLQAVASPTLEPTLRDYLIKTIKGSDQLMEKVLQSFGIDDKSRILPEAKISVQEQLYGAGARTAAENSLGQNYNSEQGEGSSLPEFAQLGSN